MTYHRIASISVTAMFIASSPATAQLSVVTIDASWQFSLDGGATWQGGIVTAPQSQGSVRVRHVVAWGASSSVDDYFGRATYAPVITGVAGAGLADAVIDIQGLRPLMQPLPPAVQGRRVGADQIKIGTNTAPAPSGSVNVFGSDPAIGLFNRGNPKSILEYDYLLDGTTGTRLFSAVWQPLPTDPSVPSLSVFAAGVPAPYTYSYTFNDATLVVVPSSSTFALIGVASVVLLRRRRR